LSCIAQVNDGTTGDAEQITNLATTLGTNYYIYVGGYSPFEIGGVFNLTVTCSSLPEATITCLDDPENDPCNDLLVEDGSITGAVEACVSILTSDEVVVESGTSANFSAGTTVRLMPGFRAEAGSTFRAFIEACTQETLEEVASELPVQQESAVFLNKDLALRVTPNPVLDETKIYLYAPAEGSMQMTLTDISGKSLRAVQGEVTEGWNELLLQREGLDDGLYFLSVTTASGMVTTEVVFTR
jgi:hypothetical protein